MWTRTPRYVVMLAIGAVIAVLGSSGHSPDNPLLTYQARALILALVLLGWWAWTATDSRQAGSFGVDIVPVIAGTIAALAMATSLVGTPFAAGGLGGDQSFRTASVTRFAVTWHLVDFTVADLPAAYPPSYFWLLGRIAALTGIEPWRMLKIGAIGSALIVPSIAYRGWRHLASGRLAALMAVVPLMVENFYEPYAWLALTAFVPWWLLSVGTSDDDGARARRTVLLGLIGAALFTTYYYFLLVGALAFAVHFVLERTITGRRTGFRTRAIALIGAVSLAVASPFWVPLAISIATAPSPDSLANRWFAEHHALVPLPMLDASLPGALMLAGVAHLVWTAGRDALSRRLLSLLVATYLWYGIGAFAALADHPLLSFRAKPIIPTVAACAGIRALAAAHQYASARCDRRDLNRLAGAVTAIISIGVGQQFLTTVLDSPLTTAARAAESPDDPNNPASAAVLQRLVEARVGERATLVSDRIDILAYYPNHAFIPWDAHYANPAAEFGERVEFLRLLAAIDDPAKFAFAAGSSRFGPIDAFVLAIDDDELVFHYLDDIFPYGTASKEVDFNRTQLAQFDLTTVGNHVLCTPQQPRSRSVT
ncbi:MAG: arabinofuranosyltransferase [Actinomycetota bacterium]